MVQDQKWWRRGEVGPEIVLQLRFNIGLDFIEVLAAFKA